MPIFLSLLLLLGPGCRGPRLAELDPGLPDVTAPPRPVEPDEVARGWFLRARVAEELGDLEEAERAWKWALRFDRESPWLWAHRAASLEDQRRWDEALAACEASWSLDPTLPAPRLVAGRVALQQGDNETAERHLRVALFDLGSAEAAPLLARLYHRVDDVERSEETLDAWLALGPLPVEDALQRARLARSLGRPSDAVDDLVRALEHPDTPWAAGRWLVAASTGACRVGTALTWAQSVELTDPEAGPVVLAVAQQAQDPRLLQRLWSNDTLTASQREELASLWWRAGSVDEALAVRPSEITRARLLTEAGRLEEALAELQGDDPDTRVARALLVARLSIEADGRSELGADPELVARFEAGWRRISEPRAVFTEALAQGRAEEALRVAADAGLVLSESESATLQRLLATGGPHDAGVWVLAAEVGVEPRRSATRALALEPCRGEARLLFVESSDCSAVPALEAAWDASPTLPEVRQRLLTAYDACGTPAMERLPVWELP